MPRCGPEAGQQEKASVGVPGRQSRRERFYGPRPLRGRAWVAKHGQRRGTQDPFPKGFPGSNPGPRITNSPLLVGEWELIGMRVRALIFLRTLIVNLQVHHLTVTTSL